MKNEKLMRAMSEIDEDLIAEAHQNIRPRVHWARWSALAAGLVLLVVSLPLFGTILQGGFLSGGAMAEADMIGVDNDAPLYSGSAPAEAEKGELYDNIHSEALEEEKPQDIIESLINGKMENSETTLALCFIGHTVRANGMELTHEETDGIFYRFAVNKSDDRPLVVKATVIRNEGSSANTFSTDGEGKEYFSFTVNGEKAETLPNEAGRYDIKVDLSEIFARFDKENSILVWIDGVGFLVGEEP